MSTVYVPTVQPFRGLDREAIRHAARANGFASVLDAVSAAGRNGWRWVYAVAPSGAVLGLWRVTDGFARPIDLTQPVRGRRQTAFNF